MQDGVGLKRKMTSRQPDAGLLPAAPVSTTGVASALGRLISYQPESVQDSPGKNRVVTHSRRLDPLHVPNAARPAPGLL
jgi:hypothetical protein